MAKSRGETQDRRDWRRRARRLIGTYARDTAKWEEADRACHLSSLLEASAPTASSYMMQEARNVRDSLARDHPSGLVLNTAAAEERTRASEKAWSELMSGDGCLPPAPEVSKMRSVFEKACSENEVARKRWEGGHEPCSEVIAWCENELPGGNTEGEDERLIQ